MTTLQQLMIDVKEQNLSKDQLEHYHSELCNLKAQLRQELGKLKKEKGMFMLAREQGESIASRTVAWNGTPSGQRKFDVESYIGSTTDLIEGVKARLYSIY